MKEISKNQQFDGSGTFGTRNSAAQEINQQKDCETCEYFNTAFYQSPCKRCNGATFPEWTTKSTVNSLVFNCKPGGYCLDPETFSKQIPREAEELLNANAFELTGPSTCRQCDELYSIINEDGSLSGHEEHVGILKDAMGALGGISAVANEIEELKRENKDLQSEYDAYRASVEPSLPPDFDPETMKWAIPDHGDKYWSQKYHAWHACADIHADDFVWVRTPKQPEQSEYLEPHEITDELLVELRAIPCEIENSADKTCLLMAKNGDSLFVKLKSEEIICCDENIVKVRRAEVDRLRKAKIGE